VWVDDFSDVTIFNSNLGGGEIRLYDFSDLTLVNTQFNKNGVYYGDIASSLTVKWFLKVLVRTDGGIPLNGANVQVEDLFNNTIYIGTSNSSGICNWILCTEYIEDSANRISHTPHEITCNTTQFGLRQVETRMQSSKTIEIIFFDTFPPLAYAGPDIYIDQHETVIFDGTLSTDNVGVVNWTWTFENNTEPITFFGPTPSYTFHHAGKFNITMSVSDGANEASDNLWVTVNDTTPPVAVAGPDINIPQHEIVLFDGTVSTDNVGISNWTWTFEYDGQPHVMVEVAPDFTFDIAGEYNVTLNVTDEAGNLGTDSLIVYVGDITNPIANAGEDLEINQHETVIFDGNQSTDNVGIVNWTWDLEYGDDDVSMYGPTPSFTFHTVGEYSANLRVTDDVQNWDEDSLMITVKDITPPEANAGADFIIGQHQRIYFNGKESTDNIEVVDWTWTFTYDRKPITLDGQSPSFFFDDVGIYHVTLKVADAVGNWDEDLVNVTVIDVTLPTADAGENHTIYQNQTVFFDGSRSHDNIGIVNWSWIIQSDHEETNLYGTNVLWVFTQVGNHTVELVVEDATGNRANDTIWVNVLSDALPTDAVTDDSDESDGTSDGKGSSNLGSYIIVLIVIIIILVVCWFFFVHRKGKDKYFQQFLLKITKEDEKQPPKEEGGEKMVKLSSLPMAIVSPPQQPNQSKPTLGTGESVTPIQDPQSLLQKAPSDTTNQSSPEGTSQGAINPQDISTPQSLNTTQGES